MSDASEGLVDQAVSTFASYGVSGAGVFGLAYVLGPSVKAFGQALGDWTDFRMRNLLRIGQAIEARRPTDGGDGDSRVHPRVAHSIFEDGSWYDDDVAHEYMAGLLLASRSHQGGDDTGIFYSQIATRMTSSQIRLHNAIYATYVGTRPPEGDSHSLDTSDGRRLLAVKAKLDDVVAAIAPKGEEASASDVKQAILGLDHHGLVGGFAVAHHSDQPDHFSAGPTSLGAQLFLWSRGQRSPTSDILRYQKLLLPEISVETTPIVGASHSWNI